MKQKNPKRVQAGREAKKAGHLKESALAKLLTKLTGHEHKKDGGPKTKQDIRCVSLNEFSSQKSALSKHTQVHLTPTWVWCKYFNIDGDLRIWFDKFFGLPGSGRAGRVGTSGIPANLNQVALDWFNEHKMSIFETIVVHGAYKVTNNEVKKGKPVTHVIWYNKKNDTIEKKVTVEYLRNIAKDCKWIFSTKKKDDATVLWFVDKNNKKLFHLQMKGSGELSGYNSLQFHIYKPYVI